MRIFEVDQNLMSTPIWSGYVLALSRDKIKATESRIDTFLQRTGLPLSEVVLVLYKTGAYPQWHGAALKAGLSL